MNKEQGQKIALASAASLIAEPIGQMMHFGGPGVIAGLAVGAVAYLIADEIQQARADEGEDTPSSTPIEKKAQNRLGLAKRLLVGKSVRSQAGRVDEILLSPEVRLSRKQIVGKSVFIVGQRRSGKTTLGARLAEQIGQYNYPMFLPDSEGDLLSLADFLPRAVIAAAPGSRWDDSNEEEQYVWIVTPEDAEVLGFQILYEGMQVILDMSSFQDEDDAWRVVVGVIDGLFEYARQYPDQLCPVEVFLDEAQKYLPQDLATSAIKDPALRDALLDAYKNLSGVGGKRGLTPVIMSQRFAETNNKIIAQSELRFILRQTQDNDLDRCKKYVRAEIATTQQIASFTKGQGVFVGESGEQIVTRFYQRESDGSRSGTPEVDAVDRFKDAPLTLQRPATGPGRPHEAKPRQKADDLVSRGADAWIAGARSIDKLAHVLGLNFNQARQLKPRVLAEVQRREQAEMESEEQQA